MSPATLRGPLEREYASITSVRYTDHASHICLRSVIGARPPATTLPPPASPSGIERSMSTPLMAYACGGGGRLILWLSYTMVDALCHISQVIFDIAAVSTHVEFPGDFHIAVVSALR
jgi:hypothetical protein